MIKNPSKIPGYRSGCGVRTTSKIYDTSVVKFSGRSVRYFYVKVANRQTNRQAYRQTGRQQTDKHRTLHN